MAVIFTFSSLTGAQVGGMMYWLREAFAWLLPPGEGGRLDWASAGHALGYFLLALSYRRAFSPLARRASLTALGASALFALSDEFHQSFVPGRSVSAADLAVDLLAAAAALLAAHWLAHRKKKPLPHDDRG